jgi:hypothetical protein
LWSPLTQELVNLLKTLPVSDVTTNKKEISVRCPFCGDSKKNIRSSHLYIKLDVQENEAHTYYCQRCKSKGIVTSTLLKMLKLFDNDLNVALGINLKNASKHNKKFRPIQKNKLIIPTPERSKINLVKLNFFNNRLGTELQLEDLPKYKIVTNLYDLLDANKVTFLTNKKTHFVDTLDKNFLGFISYDNNYTILRNLSKKVMPDLRYYNYNIFDNYDNSKRFYSIPTHIDILKPKLNVVIAEGIFDILGVYFNVYNGEAPENTLFIAVNGVGYNLIFMHLARMGFLDMNVRIYSDSDQHVSLFKNMKKELKHILPNRMEVFYNKMPKQKDFGVSKDKIKIQRTII